MIEQAVYTILSGNAGVDALCGDRISPHQRLQGTALPALVYQIDDLEPIRGLSGTVGLTAATLTVTSIDTTYAGARGLAAAVIAALNGATGTYGATVVTSIHYSQQTPLDAGIGEGEEDLPYEVSTQYRIHYTGL